MASEKYANNAISTLNGAITNVATTLVVTSAALFPPTPQFRLTIENEILLVTAVAGTTFTVTRGIEGTTAVSHVDTTPVKCLLTKGALDQIIADNQQVGVYSSIPAVEKAGRIYRITDGPYEFRDNGTIWEAFGPRYKFTLPPAATGGPSATQFGWINQNSATVTTSNGGIYLASPNHTADSWTFLVKNIPSTPYNLYVYLQPNFVHNNYTGISLVLRKSSDGTFIVFLQVSISNLLSMGVSHGTNTGPSVTVDDSGYFKLTQFYNWMRISDDGTNRTFHISMDGVNWIQFYTQAHATPLVPDQIGFGVDARNSNGFGVGVGLLSWLEA